MRPCAVGMRRAPSPIDCMRWSGGRGGTTRGLDTTMRPRSAANGPPPAWLRRDAEVPVECSGMSSLHSIHARYRVWRLRSGHVRRFRRAGAQNPTFASSYGASVACQLAASRSR